MDSTMTSVQSEPDQDNSSLQNPSTNPAEAGTTDETRDEDHETSSIEALNWSEVEEEELAAAQQAAAAAAASASLEKPSSETKVDTKADKDEENAATNNGSSSTGSNTANDERSVLSTSLLQSINSSASDEDPQARKLSVIENWASEVTNAVERGEIELQEDFPDDDNGVTGDDEDETEENVGVRKRKGKRLSPEMISSMMSTASQGDSNVDPLSNAPVLDDGPIWNKGPRSYRFQENRRINQKLTICLLIAVVLAIGLGLGNLVAHQECEAEYKSQQQNTKLPEKSPVHAGTIPTTTPPTPIIPDRSTDSTLPPKRAFPSSDSKKEIDDKLNYDDVNNYRRSLPDKRMASEVPAAKLSDMEDKVVRKRDEPIIDPKYKVHAETLSKVVNTLDRLSQKIDKFENNTRKLQGILMIPDEEEKDDTTASPSSHSALYDEQIHKDDGNLDMEEPLDTDEDEGEDAEIDELIDAIEQTPDYLEMKKAERRLKELEEIEKETGGETRSNLFASRDPNTRSEEDKEYIRTLLKTVDQFKEFQRRFVKTERKKLREEGKYHRLNWRLPEEYTTEEKNALKVRYKTSWNEFLKLIKAKVPDPIQAFFGEEEEEEERKYADVFYFPFADPDDDLTDEEIEAVFKRNLQEIRWEESIRKSGEDEQQSEPDRPKAPVLGESESETTLEDVQTVHSEPNDDLIILQSVVPEPVSVKEDDVAAVEDTKDLTQNNMSVEENIDIGKSKSVDPIVESDSSEPAANSIPTSTLDNIPSENLSAVVQPTKDNAAPIKEASSQSKKSEKSASISDNNVGVKVTNNNNNVKKRSAPSPGTTYNGKSEKRDQKQKEQKLRQGKQKANNNNNNKMSNNGQSAPNGASSVGKDGKLASNSNKKMKKVDSNKVSENVKGKSFEKRRGLSTNGKGAERRGSGVRADTIGHGDPKNSVNIEKQKNKLNKISRNSNNNNNKVNPQINSPPKYYDSKDIQDMRRSQGKERRNSNGVPSSEGSPSSRENSKVKYDSQEFSAKETQYRQQKQEFNTNYGSRSQGHQNQNTVGGNNGSGKKSKSWQSKENRSREKRERATSFGN